MKSYELMFEDFINMFFTSSSTKNFNFEKIEIKKIKIFSVINQTYSNLLKPIQTFLH
jgi:hypothetical protein